MPEVIRQCADLRERLREVRRKGASIGFVPTMGALHAGHARLLQTARRENEAVVASIFVNPLQFDRKEDLESYPQSLDADLRVCQECGAGFVFAPSVTELYPRPQLTFAESPVLSGYLCGLHRPGHFRGVATVVLKLLNIVQPHRAYFGQKDAQQLVIIRRMVQDLNLPVTVVPVETVREPDGLALSSRNQRLSPAQRQAAPVLSRALRAALDLIGRGERSVAAVRERAAAVLAKCPEARVEYFEVSDPELLAPLDRIEGPALIAGAIWLGSTRLIDNMIWPEEAAGGQERT